MRVLKVFAITISIFAVLFTGVVVYILLAEPDLLKTNDKPLAATSSTETPNKDNSADQQDESETPSKPVTAPEPVNSKPTKPAKIPSSTKSEEAEEVEPPSVPSATIEVSTPPSESASVEPTPATNAVQDPSTLLMGRWVAVNNPNLRFEFFRDGTFTRGNYHAPNDYNEFAGTYSFSSSTRLKVQYEKWTIKLDSGYKNTRPSDESYVFEIVIDENTLQIPGSKEAFGATEWTREN
ncbi:hypothetical protein [Paenibacillus solani]|uniref:Uncharacterized protein n=1 Tax=Paenibacillus solani TaxID=1705565 RepID=A0A0M1N1G4_9BACL|nr:hypothetical protein [Paenibacillus solani]KOR76002.1 hypothetical protein AM231_25475 [Paenibacillus solani]